MAHAVPEPYVWDDSFRVNYDNLDTEHKGLFKGIAACAENRGDRACLDTLLKNVVEHFADEEIMMTKKGFEGLSDHKTVHTEFVAILKDLKLPLTDANVTYSKNWLVQHIKTIDFKYMGKI